jgi:hypothetical protein
MKIVLVFLLPLLCLQLHGEADVAGLLTGKGYGKNTRAIIIANEDYQSYSSVYVENEDLAINQAERFQQMLIKKIGLLPENIQFYPDAVNTNIKLAIAKLQRSLPSDARLIFYYRGKTFTGDNGETFLVPVDVSDNETFYMFGLKDLCTRLNVLNKNGVTIFIDGIAGSRSGTACIIDNGFTEGEIPLPSVKNMSLYSLKPPSGVIKEKVPPGAGKPVIIIKEPSAKSNETKESSVLIKGKVNSDCPIEVISVNGQEAPYTDDGTFVARVTLSEGKNLIAIETRNCAGWTRDYVIFNMTPAMPDAEDLADSALYAERNFLKEPGRNFALIIGVSKYVDPIMPDLYYPIFDAKKVSDVLTGYYTFEPQNVTLLVNPTKARIISMLDSLNNILTSKDNFLLFYAGHGSWDEKTSMGYWLPSDAAAKAIDNWLMNNIITAFVSQSKARHTLVIADACFGGSIFRTRAFKPEEEKTISDLYLKSSKKAMTSGDLTEVPDESVFVKNFIQQLSDNKEIYLSSEQLFFTIKPNVIKVIDLIPQFGIIKNAGDQGGDFIFFRKKENSINKR